MTRLVTIDLDSVQQTPSGAVFYPVGAAFGTSTYSALMGVGATLEARITDAVAKAKAGGFKILQLPASMYPFDESVAVLDPAVQMWPEGGSAQPGVLDARGYGGAVNASRAIGKALEMLPASGGVVDARGFTGAQTADVDIFFNVVAEKPMKVRFGASTWTVPTGSALAGIGRFFGSNIEIELNGTTFLLADYTSQNALWNTDLTAGVTGSATVTNGSAAITIPSLTRGVVPKRRKNISIFGHIPNGGRDNTTLAAAISDTTGTSITLTSVGVPPGGIISDGAVQYVRIDNEIISFPVANCATGSNAVWTGGTRGALGTTAATHSNGAAVDRVTYDNYSIVDVSGTGPWTVTLDRPITQAPTMTGAIAVIGPADVSFTGTGVMDGGMPPGETVGDSSNNALCVIYYFGTRLKTARTIHFQNWEHGCVHVAQGRFCTIDGSFRNTGHPQVPIGFSVTFFSGSKYCTAYGDYENVNTGPCSDDRTTHSQYYDNLCEGIQLFPRSIRNVNRGAVFEGTANSYALVPYVDNWQWGGFTTGGAVMISQPQWVTPPGTLADNNTIRVGWVSPQAGAVTNVTTVLNSVIDLGGQQAAVYGTSSFGPSSGTWYSPLRMMNNYQVSIGIANVNAGHAVVYLNASPPVSLAGASFGVVADITHPSTSTSQGASHYVKARTAAASFTISQLIGVLVKDASKGAGSTITSQFGVYVESQTQGGTNNFGVYVAAQAAGGFALATAGVGVTTHADQVTMASGGVNAADNATGVMIGVGLSPATALTNAIQRAVFVDMATNSSATSRSNAIEARVRTAAASFTTAFGAGLYVLDAAKGAGSTITALYGVRVAPLTNGGTNNIGLGIDDQSGAGAFAIKTGLGLVQFGANVNLSAGVLQMVGTQVLTTRRTGWTAWTGTATRTSFDTATATLTNVAQAVKALLDDLITHGIIGA